MSQDQLQRAYQLMQNGQFDEARAILASIDHPQVPQLLGMLTQMEATAEQMSAGDAVPSVEDVPASEPAAAQPPEEGTISDLLGRLDAQLTSPPEHEPVRSSPTTTTSDGRRVTQTGTYEMLWDCQYCGTNKLLGKTHRYCPNCGAAQNPDSRYFPDEGDEVAVEDHAYVGADLICPACDSLNVGNAHYCTECGTTLEDSPRARTLAEQRRSSGEMFVSSGSRDITKEKFDAEMQRVGVQTAPGSQQSSGNRRIYTAIAIVVIAILALGGFAAWRLWTNETSVSLAERTWERNIYIEEFRAVSQSEWCDSMPVDAYSVRREREVRSYRQVPDGEICDTVRVDQGDGTYRTERQCRTKYRDEPVYDDKCYFTVNRWTSSRTETESGHSDVEPYWPTVSLRCEGQSQLGCERESRRVADYTFNLFDAENDKDFTCNVEEGVWRSAQLNSRWTLDVGAIFGDARCDTLQALP